MINTSPFDDKQAQKVNVDTIGLYDLHKYSCD